MNAVHLCEIQVRIHLAETTVADRGIPYLSALANLKAIDLSRTVVSDVGIVNLNTLTNLEYLELTETFVTLHGVLCLAELPELSYLDITGTFIDEADLAELQKQIPHLTSVIWSKDKVRGNVDRFVTD